MSPPAQAVVAFAAANYDVSGPVVGRQSASRGFLEGYLRHGGAERYVALSNAPGEAEAFRAEVAGHAPPGTGAEILLPDQLARVADTGTLYRPGPDLAYYAWLRRSLGQRSFSITGVNHTLAGNDAATAIGGLLTGPVQEWDALVCASRASRAVVERVLGEYARYFETLGGVALTPRPRLPVIPLGVDCAAFRPPEGDAAARAAERARLGIAEDEVVLLYLGRLNHVEKANPLPMYVAAEQAAAATGRRLRLIEAGWFPGPRYPEIFAQGAATMAPSVSRLVLDATRPENRRVWFAADMFATLSDNIQESFGLTPIEAMAAGLPVVASDWDGYRDGVRDGVEGFLVRTIAPPPGTAESLSFLFAASFGGLDLLCGGASQGTAVDPAAAAAAIQALVENPDLRRRMGDAGRERARAFDWPAVIASYQALWAELAAVRARAAEAAPPAPGRPARPLAIEPFDLFRAFPTNLLAPTTEIVLTEGITPPMAQGMARLPLAAPLRWRLAPDAGIARMVELLGHGPQPAGALVAALPADQREAAWLTVGWLLKTGLATWR